MAAHLALVRTLAPDTRFAAESLIFGVGAGTNCTRYFEIYFSSSSGDDPGILEHGVREDDGTEGHKAVDSSPKLEGEGSGVRTTKPAATEGDLQSHVRGGPEVREVIDSAPELEDSS